ncbi:unannotated protein [freshwater metagenome]|uniref:Unannotated protein n=1 Tax=freshwater metagenome TaxID=449393 RepID=A0A6J5YX85_9ZZZZ|nr:nucleotide sugar dehydrogenase [Actinomycetota bacterium]
MQAVVVALGKIGLPLAVQIARNGHSVVGCDINPEFVELVNQAQPPFPGEEGLAEALAEVIASGALRAQLDTTAAVAEGPDLVVTVPPLAVDGEAKPDWTALDAAIGAIGAGLKAGTTVAIETTLPVGTTRNRIAPALSAASGLTAEQDFFTVFSPERVFSGRIFADLAAYPKLLGGLSAAGEARGVELYRSFLEAEVRPMGSAEAAEMVKLAETTYRDINIAFANELARFADREGIDVERVIEAANSQPFSHIHSPGIAVGGHCIPVYPRFYLEGDPDATLPGAARAVNDEMPRYAAQRLEKALGGLQGARVLVLGAAYRGGVKETAFSGVFGVTAALEALGATALVSDPLYSDDELASLGLTAWDGGPIDAAIVQADHAEYAQLGAADLPGARVVLDGRAIVDAASLASAGIAVERIGRPATSPPAS